MSCLYMRGRLVPFGGRLVRDGDGLSAPRPRSCLGLDGHEPQRGVRRLSEHDPALVHLFTNTMTYKKGAKPFLISELLYFSLHFDLSCAEIQEES